MALTLVIGNKNYSSWSMRPWMAMRVLGIPFEEVLIPLYEPGSAEKIRVYSPAGKVPILIDGDVRVWESLAIIDHLAESWPGLWPRERSARAHARAIAAEMHAGFMALRRECTMNLWLPPRKASLSPDAQANIRRIDEMWTECRARFGSGGPFLFGGFSAADAMYAPVVARFETYLADVGDVSRAYIEAVWSLPAWSEWRTAAFAESWVQKHNEPNWPRVRRRAP